MDPGDGDLTWDDFWPYHRCCRHCLLMLPHRHIGRTGSKPIGMALFIFRDGDHE